MKNCLKKLTALFLSALFIINIVPQSAFAANNANISNNAVISTAEIEGITYTYNTEISNNKRITTISNNFNNKIDTIVYDITDSTVYCNDEAIAIINTSALPIGELLSSGTHSPLNDDIWTLLSSDSKRITWLDTVTVAVWAEIVATRLGVMTGAMVITQMGVGIITAIVDRTIGGTLYMSNFVLFAHPAPNSYRIDWRFVADSGDSYGPYTYMYA